MRNAAERNAISSDKTVMSSFIKGDKDGTMCFELMPVYENTRLYC